MDNDLGKRSPFGEEGSLASPAQLEGSETGSMFSNQSETEVSRPEDSPEWLSRIEASADADTGFIPILPPVTSKKSNEVQVSTMYSLNGDPSISDDHLAPWMSDSTRKIKNPWLRLHTEIIEFRHFLKPKPEELNRRTQSVARMTKLLHGLFPNGKAMVIGSTITRMMLPGSDIDIVVIAPIQRKDMIKILRDSIKDNPSFEAVELQPRSRLPLVRAVESSTGFVFDISFNKLTGVEQVMEKLHAMDQHPEFAPIFLIFKLVLAQRNLNETYFGGIGSYLLYCMCITYIKMRKDEHKKEEQELSKAGKPCKPLLLSEFLVGMMQFFSKQFDTRTQYIQMFYMEGRVMKKPKPRACFSLKLALKYGGYEIGQQSFRYNSFMVFMRAMSELLQNLQFVEGQSILKLVVNAKETNFVEQLTKLKAN